MFSFLNKKYAQLGDPGFFRSAPVICFICDILVFYYMIVIQLPKILSASTVKLAISMQNAEVARNMNHSDFVDISLMIQNQIAFGLTCFLALHLLIYTMAAFKKAWPLKYISNYTFFGSILTVVEVIMVLIQSGKISIYTFISLFGYTFIYLGYRYFKKVAK